MPIRESGVLSGWLGINQPNREVFDATAHPEYLVQCRQRDPFETAATAYNQPG